MEWNGKRVLVTGGAGFIGSHVADAMLERGAHVRAFDNLSTGFVEFVPARPRFEFIRGDLLDVPAVSEAMRGVDFVFHLAANADIKDNLLDPRKCVDQNIVATQNVLEAMRACGVRQVAFSSTGSVYGEAAVIPTPEDAPFPVQTSIYATSKVAAEGLLSSYVLGFDFRAWIFRFVSILGPRYTHGHVIDFWRKLKQDPTRLDVLGDGKQKKSYLHVHDCIAAMLVAVERSEGPLGIFNLGHADWIEVKDSVRIITRELGLTPRLVYAGGERGWVGDSPKILLDTTRIRSLGWSPSKSIEDGVVETLRFLRENPFTEARFLGAQRAPRHA